MSFTILPKRLSFFYMSLFAITLAGFILRVLAARGQLWLDEIWSLMLLEDLAAAHEIFWNISHLNNHLLNSLWLWITGPDAPSVWQRFASIALGTATIPVAAVFIRRHAGDAGGLACALIFAVGHIFVHYGSEARGYGGLALMIVLCADAADRLMAEPKRRAPVVGFAIFAALGCLFHYTMLLAIGVCGAGAALLLAANKECWRENMLALLRLGVAAIVALLPAVICFFAAARVKPFLTGERTPFSYADLAEGLAGMARSTLGLPAALPDPLMLFLAALLAAGALALCPGRLRAPTLVALALLPLLEIWFALPNLHYARFHLPAACFLALAAGAGIGLLWTRGGWRRGLALSLGAAGLLGHGALVGELLAYGRGDAAGAVAKMTQAGPALYDGDFPLETSWVVAHHLARSPTKDLALAPRGAACDTPADWFIATNWRGSRPALRDRETFGPAACPGAFARVAHYPSARLSGLDWTLYRRLPVKSATLDVPLISR